LPQYVIVYLGGDQPTPPFTLRMVPRPSPGSAFRSLLLCPFCLSSAFLSLLVAFQVACCLCVLGTPSSTSKTIYYSVHRHTRNQSEGVHQISAYFGGRVRE